jgi:DNA-binding CsgD family transcriptional regulator
MQTWHVATASGSAPVAASSVAHLLEASACAQPAVPLLAFIDSIVPVDHLSLVEYVARAREGVATPELVEGLSAPDIPNVTPACFALYRERFWRQDEATRLAQHLGDESMPLMALRFAPGDICVPSWRREIYERVSLEDRLSFFYSPLHGRAFAINLYRGRRHGPFASAEIQRLLAVAPLLRQAHRAGLGHLVRQHDMDARIAHAASTLARRLPELSARECAVCARIACGISADGIAAELDVAPSTVTTLRKRAYAKVTRRGLGSGRAALASLAQ